MNWAIIIIATLVVICWIGSVIAYIFESRRERPTKSFQITEFDPRIFQWLGWFGNLVWFLLASIVVVLVAPIFILEWLLREKPTPKV